MFTENDTVCLKRDAGNNKSRGTLWWYSKRHQGLKNTVLGYNISMSDWYKNIYIKKVHTVFCTWPCQEFNSNMCWQSTDNLWSGRSVPLILWSLRRFCINFMHMICQVFVFCLTIHSGILVVCECRCFKE